ncbi:hypothetical protein A6U98_07810 [Rhizobium sp. WYCCWR10014]|uniref:hypothetical protein n=1 Tax=Rhizobium sp. WYCCWR10014 TaxID=1825933 RepID=UPI0007E3A95F|nr:hypothetical protein [Rhizobium sp. WYCCWR10014]OAV50925.1 hypothetical protein A6U98_07810 [Rhizobium sp. WYCCWR10014]
MTGLINSQKYLLKLQRFDLAYLISMAVLSVRSSRGPWDLDQDTLVLTAPRPFSDAIRALPDYDRKRLAEALCANEAAFQLNYGLDPDDIHAEPSNVDQVEGSEAALPNLILQKEMMISVATGGQRIQDVNDYYRARHVDLKSSVPALGLSYSNPHDDLWSWYHYWRAHLPQYADRRQYVRELFDPLIAAASNRTSIAVVEREPTGWERVDRALSKAQAQLAGATNEEDFQTVGMLCREVLISVGQAVYDGERHVTLDGVKPSSTDAKRMLEAFLHSVFPGDSFKEVRGHARASVDLGLNLHHRRTATRQLAELCLEATASTSAVMKILSQNAQAM